MDYLLIMKHSLLDAGLEPVDTKISKARILYQFTYC